MNQTHAGPPESSAPELTADATAPQTHELCLLTGEAVVVKPTGRFGRALAGMMSSVMGCALSTPDDELYADLQKTHPEWDEERLTREIPKRREQKMSEAMTKAVQFVAADMNAMYLLAGTAVGHDLAWAEDNLTPGEAADIVERAWDPVFGVDRYLGNLPSLLTRVVPGAANLTDDELKQVLSDFQGTQPESSD